MKNTFRSQATIRSRPEPIVVVMTFVGSNDNIETKKEKKGEKKRKKELKCREQVKDIYNNKQGG